MSSATRPCPFQVKARLFMLVSVSGCSAPSTLVFVSITCTSSSSASFHRPCFPYVANPSPQRLQISQVALNTVVCSDGDPQNGWHRYFAYCWNLKSAYQFGKGPSSQDLPQYVWKPLRLSPRQREIYPQYPLVVPLHGWIEIGVGMTCEWMEEVSRGACWRSSIRWNCFMLTRTGSWSLTLFIFGRDWLRSTVARWRFWSSDMPAVVEILCSTPDPPSPPTA